MAFKVTKIIDGDTFEVSPNWEWDSKSGNVVRPTGFDAPETGTPFSKRTTDQLSKIILGKDVELKNAKTISYGRIVCDVFINGKNLSDFFPKYKL
jgi:endonuclease YncB( thermonuclease family)